MRRGWGALGAVLALTLLLAACANNEEPGGGGATSGSPSPTVNTLEAGKLKVGSCLDYKPFEYYKGGQLLGFDVELIEAIAGKMGLEVEWVKANFNTIFTALDAGQFDAVAAASTITDERKQIVDFTDPYYNARQSLSVNTSQTPDITTTDGLQSGDVVGVQKGTTGKAWADDNLGPKGIQVKTYTNAPDAFTDLEAGQITGVINDEPSSLSEVEGRANLKVVQPIDTGEHYGFAVSQDNPGLTEAMNQALAALIADGTYEQLFKKYFPTLPLPDEYQPSA